MCFIFHSAAPAQRVSDSVLEKLEADLQGKLFLGGDRPSKADAQALESLGPKSTLGYARVTDWASLVHQFAPALRNAW